jgi:UDP-N-acetylglucosamine diphosphorylase / glucose-1-phosphate thymidylyltransferase / UDP-N-acetylgalactosamine diphosphorylase / glucosamine-1-phosphate N-acetyltransferase / galactosamine-1-phosphate N-acetyltransferase
MPTAHRPVPVIVFEDSTRVPPIDDLRPSFLVRTGAWSFLERLMHDPRVSVVGVAVSPERTALTHEALAHHGLKVLVNPPTARAEVFAVQGRGTLLPDAVLQLALGESLVDQDTPTSGVIASHIRPDPEVLARLLSGSSTGTTHLAPHRTLISRPWHVRTFRDAALARDQELMAPFLSPATLPAGSTLIGTRSVLAGPHATIHPATLFDTTLGPITLSDHAIIRPGAILIGPCHVGHHSTILERATIRPNTAIGPHCKVNGEVGGTIFQGFSNKAHDGYLGDSWLGEWVNLGAGTTNSNLLNTYAETIAKATPDARHERTGEQFLGAVIGDHVKTAICTRIMTASVLHTGSMFATTALVAGTIAPFTWATDAGSMLYRFEKFLEVAHAAMARRKVVAGPAYLDALHQLAEIASRGSR